jgi:hypothetical protein
VNPDILFRICNLLALSGWLILIFAGRRRWASGLVSGYAIPLALGLFYIALVALHWGESPGSFGSLDGVASLFSNRWVLLAGWIHYLAFDLFIGSWQVRDGHEKGVPHLLLLPSLGLTFFFGPAGLVLYFATRTAYLRQP